MEQCEKSKLFIFKGHVHTENKYSVIVNGNVVEPVDDAVHLGNAISTCDKTVM